MSSHEQVTQEMRDAFDAVCKGRVEAAVKAEREALIHYFNEHWRSDWSDGQIIEALEARGNT